MFIVKGSDGHVYARVDKREAALAGISMHERSRKSGPPAANATDRENMKTVAAKLTFEIIEQR